jgi:hypothetical protein
MAPAKLSTGIAEAGKASIVALNNAADAAIILTFMAFLPQRLCVSPPETLPH